MSINFFGVAKLIHYTYTIPIQVGRGEIDREILDDSSLSAISEFTALFTNFLMFRKN